eukprot:GHVS01036755.1.p3 GENE.GHVS01036755.1~~GHVS01036755.1.p3  ORF type:complete len:110 (-),score=8.80 GHVS01036755.1:493-822(-)
MSEPWYRTICTTPTTSQPTPTTFLFSWMENFSSLARAVVAAIVPHMIYDYIRLQRGDPPFFEFVLVLLGGVLNAFNDIVVGDNKCGISPYKCCKEEGFYASSGWDRVSD